MADDVPLSSMPVRDDNSNANVPLASLQPQGSNSGFFSWLPQWMRPKPDSPAAADAEAQIVRRLRNLPIEAATVLPSFWDYAADRAAGAVNYVAPDSLADVSLRSARHFYERDPAALRDLADTIQTPEFQAQHSWAADPAIAQRFRDQATQLETDPQLRAAIGRRHQRFQDVTNALDGPPSAGQQKNGPRPGP